MRSLQALHLSEEQQEENKIPSEPWKCGAGYLSGGGRTFSFIKLINKSTSPSPAKTGKMGFQHSPP